jgi:hypothetical protein
MPQTDTARHAFTARFAGNAARTQAAALQRLRDAGLTEAEIAIAQEHFKALFTRLLTDADILYGVYEDLRVSQPHRTVANQEWLDAQFAQLLYGYQRAMVELAAGSIQHATYTARKSMWIVDLRQVAKVIIWLLGLFAGVLLCLALNESLFGGSGTASYLVVGYGLLLFIMLWRRVGMATWGLLLPVSLVAVLFLLAWGLYT